MQVLHSLVHPFDKKIPHFVKQTQYSDVLSFTDIVNILKELEMEAFVDGCGFVHSSYPSLSLEGIHLIDDRSSPSFGSIDLKVNE